MKSNVKSGRCCSGGCGRDCVGFKDYKLVGGGLTDSKRIVVVYDEFEDESVRFQALGNLSDGREGGLTADEERRLASLLAFGIGVLGRSVKARRPGAGVRVCLDEACDLVGAGVSSLEGMGLIE